MQDVILRFRDGHTERANLASIDSEREVVTADDRGDIPFTDLKAIFFPRSVPEEALEPPAGSLIAVEFADGEVIRGNAAFDPERSGFFLFPLDRSKNERIFVVKAAIASIEVEKL
jgi:hypothetical protein